MRTTRLLGSVKPVVRRSTLIFHRLAQKFLRLSFRHSGICILPQSNSLFSSLAFPSCSLVLHSSSIVLPISCQFVRFFLSFLQLSLCCLSTFLSASFFSFSPVLASNTRLGNLSSVTGISLANHVNCCFSSIRGSRFSSSLHSDFIKVCFFYHYVSKALNTTGLYSLLCLPSTAVLST